MQSPDWVQLADAKFWGLMAAILAAACMGYAFLVYVFKQWINSAQNDSKHKTDQIAKLVIDANFNTEMMIKTTQDNTHALTMISETNRRIADVVERCPIRNGDEDN